MDRPATRQELALCTAISAMVNEQVAATEDWTGSVARTHAQRQASKPAPVDFKPSPGGASTRMGRHGITYDCEPGTGVARLAESLAGTVVRTREKKILDAAYGDSGAGLAGFVSVNDPVDRLMEAAASVVELTARRPRAAVYEHHDLQDLKAQARLEHDTAALIVPETSVLVVNGIACYPVMACRRSFVSASESFVWAYMTVGAQLEDFLRSEPASIESANVAAFMGCADSDGIFWCEATKGAMGGPQITGWIRAGAALVNPAGVALMEYPEP